jgi:hypothetical protein
MVELAG